MTSERGGGRVRGVSLAAVVLLLLGAAGAYQLGKPKSQQSPAGGVLTTAEKAPRESVSLPVTGDQAVVPIDPGTLSDFSAAMPAPTLPRSTSTSAPEPPAASIGTPAGTSGPLALGTYSYAVTGTERATGFGSRAYPSTMTLTAHREGGIAKDHAIHDLAFSPQHSERVIVAYRSDSIALTFEGGSITFGPMTQTTAADYVPAVVQVPLPLRAGDTHRGTTQAQPKDGSVARTEDWTVSVVGEETIKVAGKTTPTWVVKIDRKTRPGAADQAQKSRTYWYDPARRTWVKWKETAHSERKTLGVSFVYDATYEATLTRFAPA